MESSNNKTNQTEDTPTARREAADKAIDHAFDLMGNPSIPEEVVCEAFKEANRLLSLCEPFGATPDFVK